MNFIKQKDDKIIYRVREIIENGMQVQLIEKNLRNKITIKIEDENCDKLFE